MVDWSPRDTLLGLQWCAGCDSTTLDPWAPSLYSYSPFYAPQDPALHGGAVYGERLWMTGAASDGLAALLGADATTMTTAAAAANACWCATRRPFRATPQRS